MTYPGIALKILVLQEEEVFSETETFSNREIMAYATECLSCLIGMLQVPYYFGSNIL